MCTVTFFPDDGNGYKIAMNRDESRQRAPALPPETGFQNGVRFIRPIDGDEKGTWIGINEYKLGFCLINWFQAYLQDNGSDNYRTRGEIIPTLMPFSNLSDCHARLSQLDLIRYRPFRLLGFQVNPLKIMQWRWNGSGLIRLDEPLKANIWTSSGYDPEGVHHSRKSIFERLVSASPQPTIEQLRHLHASTEPEKGIYSIAMWHERAYSVSSTIIEATGNPVSMYYIDGYPPDSDTIQRYTL